MDAECLPQSWAVVIGGAILQNRVRALIPPEVKAALPPNTDVTYALIPRIHMLPKDVQFVVRDAFAQSIQVIWIVMFCVSAMGFLSVFLMREEKMRSDRDEKWALLEDEPEKKKAELA
jgi:hypothetical protein